MAAPADVLAPLYQVGEQLNALMPHNVLAALMSGGGTWSHQWYVQGFYGSSPRLTTHENPELVIGLGNFRRGERFNLVIVPAYDTTIHYKVFEDDPNSNTGTKLAYERTLNHPASISHGFPAVYPEVEIWAQEILPKRRGGGGSAHARRM